MKNNHRVSIVYFIVLVFALGSCSTPEVAEAEKQVEVQKNEVEFTGKQAENLPLELTDLTESSFEKTIQATGQIKVSPENSIAITFPISGNITWLKKGLLSGSLVNKGERLAEIYSLEAIRLQEEFQVLRVQQKRVLAEKERQKKLASAEATSQKIRQEVEENYEMNQIRLSSIKAQLVAIGLGEKELMSGQIIRQLPVRSPISGTLVQVLVQVGGKVAEMESLFQLAEVKKGMIVCKLHQEDVQNIQIGQGVHFPKYPSWSGRIEQIGAIADEQNQTVDVYVRVNGMQNIQLDQRLQVEIQTMTKRANTLPTSAIQTSESGEKFVWVKYQEKDRVVFKQIPVKIGETNGSRVVVLSPAVLEKVVSTGAIYLVTEREE